MDQIYARVKRLRNNPFCRAVSGEQLFSFEEPPASSCEEYDPSTLLEEGEWYKLSGFREQEYSLDVLTTGLVSADVPELQKNQFESISYLLAVQDGTYLFQRVRPGSMLKRKTIVFGDAAVVEEPRSRIIINPLPDAVYLPESDTLLFRDLAAISPIFPGIDTLYREATDDQVREFLENDFIETELEPGAVSKPNRKRIALAMDTLKSLSDAERGELFAYIREYSEDQLKFDVDRGVFTVATDGELKTLVYGIEQRFYTTGVGSEKRLANSIVRLTTPAGGAMVVPQS